MTERNFILYADNFTPEAHPTKESALRSARDRQFEAFEIRDESLDVQVYVEYPKTIWV